MGMFDLNKDGKVDLKDFVLLLKGVVWPVVGPMAEEVLEETITKQVFEGSDEWRDSCRRTCAKSDWSPAPAAVQALSEADRNYVIDMVGDKYENEFAAKAESLVKRALKALAAKLGITL